jgi:hypothetical protein
MNCPEVRARLHAFVYGDLGRAEAVQVETHCASCAACRKERAALQGVRQSLDALPASATRVNLSRLYADAATLQQRQLRRWRRAAVALLGAAAVLLLVLGLGLEFRFDAKQLVVRWGAAPEKVITPPTPTVTSTDGMNSTPTTISAEEFQLLKDLIHALAADGDTRDRRWQQEVSALQARLTILQERSQQRDRVVAALYTAQFIPRDKGEKP